MRIHTSIPLTRDQIVAALQDQKPHRIAPHVGFKRLTRHNTTARTEGGDRYADAWEVQLEAEERDRGRRVGNSGSYGAMRAAVDGYAATFDEWGWFLAALYELDPKMIVGSPKYPTYRGRQDFHDRTGWTYRPASLIDYIQNNGLDPFPYVRKSAARKGREGSVRSDGDHTSWGMPLTRRDLERDWKYAPRTVEEVRASGWDA